MAEAVAEWVSSVDVKTSYAGLRPVSDTAPSSADFMARVRAVGEKWAGDRRSDLVDTLLQAAAGNPELVDMVRNSGSLLAEFMEGFQRNGAGPAMSVPRDLAAELIAGRPVPQAVLDSLASRYLIVVVRGSVMGRGKAVPAELAGPGVLSTRHDGDLVLLVPDVDATRTSRVTGHLDQWLNGEGWLVIAKRGRAQLAEGFKEAGDVMRLVAAGRRPSGSYSISDVLVEYAVIRHEGVAQNLAAVIKPLRAHAVLWETLTALIDADYNRNKAAKNLFIHRSTLDYRLQRIASVTGCDPTSGRGVQLLTTALIADSVR
ncbi:helix-turn-helix domain-containing protein [Lentzea sp. NBC_00516]|uniref:PucR family transcriptional regulator n=1 Tax=Lentzea sp. NBC_00516 TaxID=2903582 RepID=UPI002E7FFB5E|nr:helix-turn-helix domain-containing protein [Lentzea sp. NBC_00516]WUD28548.1 helix-turn-helix domain-containing protein [Lentzea sp. NBC_00516]